MLCDPFHKQSPFFRTSVNRVFLSTILLRCDVIILQAWDLLRPYASASQRSVNFSRPAVTKTSLEFPMDDNRTSRRNRYRDNSRARSMSPMPGGRQPHHDTNYSNGTSPQFGPQFGPGPQHGGPQFSNGLQFNPGQHGPQFGHQLGPNDTPLSSQTMRMVCA